jgi:plasmid stabilization system protein ParE
VKRLRVQWREEALADLQRYYDWLKAVEGANPARVIRRIRMAANSMRRLGDIGRPGGKRGARELSVRNAPYVIVYVVIGEIADIMAVYHTAQDR